MDSNYFEPSRILAVKGATILFTPMCNKVALNHPFVERPPYYSHFIARSHENRCWLVGTDWILANDGNRMCPGHSVIYDPDGREIARSDEGKEHLLIADIGHLYKDKGRRVNGSFTLFKQLIWT